MTVNATPLWMQGLSTHTANMYRRFLDGISNLKGGIFTSSDFLVTQNGTPNMTVNVAPGMAFVRGTEDATYQGMYWVENQASQNVSISAAHATLNRIDLVVLRIRDNAYSTGPSNDATAFVVVGTPASSPAAPAVPPNSYVLAQVTIAAAVTTILTANIANQRTTTAGQGFAGLRGAFRRTASTTRPTTNLQAYQDFIIEDDTNRMYYHDGSIWKPATSGPSVAVATTSVAMPLAFATVTGATISLTAGSWMVMAKGHEVQTATAAQYDARLRNTTDSTDLDSVSIFVSGSQRISWSLFGTLTNTATKSISLQHMVGSASGAQTTDNCKIWALPVSAIL